ncbi:MAG: hypothetical protein U7123_18490 [Potamolinea sp.]
MFNQFRFHYPKGSLVTELSAIDHGKYIVRCLVQVEGTTLVTSLAAAETVELAEDKARSRAIEILGISSTTTTQNISAGLSENLAAAKLVAPVQEIPKVSSEVSVPLTPNLSVSTGVSEASEVTTATSKESLAVTQPNSFSEEPKTSDSVVFSADESKSEVTSNFTATTPVVADSVLESPGRERTETAVPEASLVETSQEVTSPISMPENVSQTELDNGPIPSSFPSQVETDTSSISASDTPVDFSEIIARTNVELKRLGWTNPQGRDYLVQTYGKRSRLELTNEELLDFLQYLEKLPNPD